MIFSVEPLGVCFAATDGAAKIEAIKEVGSQVVSGPMTVPSVGGSNLVQTEG